MNNKKKERRIRQPDASWTGELRRFLNADDAHNGMMKDGAVGSCVQSSNREKLANNAEHDPSAGRRSWPVQRAQCKRIRFSMSTAR